jgi:hypothetical protein
MTVGCRGQDRSGKTTVWIGSDPGETRRHSRFNHCTECSGDEPREAAEASFCLFYGPATPSPGQGRRSEYSHCAAAEASDSCSMMIGLRAQAGLLLLRLTPNSLSQEALGICSNNQNLSKTERTRATSSLDGTGACVPLQGASQSKQTPVPKGRQRRCTGASGWR